MATILIVDDEANVHRLLEANLSGRGHATRSAFNGKQALAMIRDSRPDLIILDATMPEMDGWAVLDTLKTGPETATIPVIMCTAQDRLGDVETGFSKGAVAYVTKPFDLKRLLAKVDQALTGKSTGGGA